MAIMMYKLVELISCVTRFFRSANNVILSPGDKDGFIPLEYFLRVKNVKTNTVIFSNE